MENPPPPAPSAILLLPDRRVNPRRYGARMAHDANTMATSGKRISRRGEDGSVSVRCTSLHVGEGAVVGVLESESVVVVDHVVVDGGEDARHERLADLAAVAVPVLLEQLVERLDARALRHTPQ